MGYATKASPLHNDLVRSETGTMFLGEAASGKAFPYRGGLTGIASGKFVPASDYATAAAFVAVFAGVCTKQMESTDTDRKMGVWRTATIEMELAGADLTPNPGDTVEPFVEGGVVTAHKCQLGATSVIGRVVRKIHQSADKTADTTRVLVRIEGVLTS